MEYSPVDSCSSSFDRITANEIYNEGAESEDDKVVGNETIEELHTKVSDDEMGVAKINEDDVLSASCEAEARQTDDDNGGCGWWWVWLIVIKMVN